MKVAGKVSFPDEAWEKILVPIVNRSITYLFQLSRTGPRNACKEIAKSNLNV
jgi:hypothetical protein